MAKAPIKMCIDRHGQVRLIYSDEAHALARQIGTTITRRASHVEPDATGNWTADMSPVKGPLLGPFVTHQEALDAEQAWLLANGIPFPEEKDT